MRMQAMTEILSAGDATARRLADGARTHEAMNKGKLTVLVAFILAGLVALGFRFFGQVGVTKGPTVSVGGGAAPSLAGQFRGMVLQMHNPGDKNHPYEKFIDEIARSGANTVCLTVSAYQEDGSSSSIFIDARKTPTDDRIRGLVRHAHAKGLRVMFTPIVLLENGRDGEWRGKISPNSWTRWWQKYTEYILHYAYLCNETRVEAFVVGSELLSTEPQTPRWRRLIARVRGAYDGLLSYSANWDHYRVPKFWDDLDMIGMTTYYNLTGGQKPTLARLKEAWVPLKREILNWQATIKKPILFTEVGWPNQPTCAQYPWNYLQSDKTDPQAQANCFEAFFDTWINEKLVAGFLVWEWRRNLTKTLDPDKDISYVPCEKPAMKVISRYYRLPGPWEAEPPRGRPAATQPKQPPPAK